MVQRGSKESKEQTRAEKETKPPCGGEETVEITEVVGYGNKRSSAYDNMWAIVAMSCSTSTCSGQCTGDDECLPVSYLDEENVDCRPYRTKDGQIKWRCRYRGEARCVCECLPG